jgi:hypothetical protein
MHDEDDEEEELLRGGKKSFERINTFLCICSSRNGDRGMGMGITDVILERRYDSFANVRYYII